MKAKKKKVARLNNNKQREKIFTSVSATIKKVLDKSGMTMIPVVTIANGQIRSDIQIIFKE